MNGQRQLHAIAFTLTTDYFAFGNFAGDQRQDYAVSIDGRWDIDGLGRVNVSFSDSADELLIPGFYSFQFGSNGIFEIRDPLVTTGSLNGVNLSRFIDAPSVTIPISIPPEMIVSVSGGSAVTSLLSDVSLTSALTLEYLDKPLEPSVPSSLIFREKVDSEKEATFWGLKGDEIPGFDHAALNFRGEVYESHPGYPSGSEFWDPDRLAFRRINSVNGVQFEHSIGSFRHDSTEILTTPVVQFEQIPIPDDLAAAMASAIESKRGSKFQVINTEFPNGVFETLRPEAQKGGGNTFTCVGLIEWSAEFVGHRSGEGFIPNAFEQIVIPGEDVIIPTLSPELLFGVERLRRTVNDVTGAIEDLVDGASDWLQGVFDPVDFMLTDPLGRRLGYTDEAGYVNEIPGSFYTGDGIFEQFLILDPLDGEYDLELFGLEADVYGGIGTGTTGKGLFISRYLAKGESLRRVINVPEPTSFVLVAIALLFSVRSCRLFSS
ncbi:MAG: hypothetical protein R3E01_05655 [Pirellulaceae bacterium]